MGTDDEFNDEALQEIILSQHPELISPMKMDEFINKALQAKHAECCIKISQYPGLFKELGEGLKAQGIPSSEIVDMLWLNLKGMCPRCFGIIVGSKLGKLNSMATIGWDKITVVGPGRAFRFAKGLCLNENCSSTCIMLSWHPYHDLFKERKDVERLIKVLETEKYWFAREKAAEALGNMRNAKAVEPLITALKDENGDVRWKAVVALGEIGDKKAIDSLNNLLRNENNDLIRESAKEVLEKIKADKS